MFPIYFPDAIVVVVDVGCSFQISLLKFSSVGVWLAIIENEFADCVPRIKEMKNHKNQCTKQKIVKFF